MSPNMADYQDIVDAHQPESGTLRDARRAPYDLTAEIIDAEDDARAIDACFEETARQHALAVRDQGENAWITSTLDEPLRCTLASTRCASRRLRRRRPWSRRRARRVRWSRRRRCRRHCCLRRRRRRRPMHDSRAIQDSMCYVDLVYKANNGICDGGRGSVSSICAHGTDFPDCDARCPLPPPPPPPASGGGS